MTNAEIAQGIIPVLYCTQGHGYGRCKEDHNAMTRRDVVAALDAKDAEIAGWKRNWASDGRTIDSPWKQLADAHAEIEKLKTTRSLQAQEIKRLTPIRESALCHSFVAFHDCTHTHEALKQQLADAKRATWEKAIQLVHQRELMVGESGLASLMRRAMEEDLAS